MLTHLNTAGAPSLYFTRFVVHHIDPVQHSALLLCDLVHYSMFLSEHWSLRAKLCHPFPIGCQHYSSRVQWLIEVCLIALCCVRFRWAILLRSWFNIQCILDTTCFTNLASPSDAKPTQRGEGTYQSDSCYKSEHPPPPDCSANLLSWLNYSWCRRQQIIMRLATHTSYLFWWRTSTVLKQVNHIWFFFHFWGDTDVRTHLHKYIHYWNHFGSFWTHTVNVTLPVSSISIFFSWD